MEKRETLTRLMELEEMHFYINKACDDANSISTEIGRLSDEIYALKSKNELPVKNNKIKFKGGFMPIISLLLMFVLLSASVVLVVVYQMDLLPDIESVILSLVFYVFYFACCIATYTIFLLVFMFYDNAKDFKLRDALGYFVGGGIFFVIVDIIVGLFSRNAARIIEKIIIYGSLVLTVINFIFALTAWFRSNFIKNSKLCITQEEKNNIEKLLSEKMKLRESYENNFYDLDKVIEKSNKIITDCNIIPQEYKEERKLVYIIKLLCDERVDNIYDAIELLESDFESNADNVNIVIDDTINKIYGEFKVKLNSQI